MLVPITLCVSRTIFCHDGRKNKCACTQMVITIILMLLRLLLHMESCSKSLKESRIGGWSMGLIVSWPSDFSPIYCVKYSWVTSIFRHINFFQSTQNHLCGSCCSSKWKTHAHAHTHACTRTRQRQTEREIKRFRWFWRKHNQLVIKRNKESSPGLVCVYLKRYTKSACWL